MEVKHNEKLCLESVRTKIGQVTRLAAETKSRAFTGESLGDETYLLDDGEIQVKAKLRKGRGKNKGTLRIDGCVESDVDFSDSFYDGVNINGIGPSGWELRPPQKGAIHGLLCHWSLSSEVATIVLPTGTGKTETMLVASLVDKASKTLIIVPTIELKEQIAEKFGTWGMLRKLGVLSNK
ncbi:DEAD/DEAH box helicase family protein [Aliiglaciecola litoralis]|uniref:Helicase/UvrB N-terminal domain-containing protein n=1 Tax=Aliiglaciecola litoralis TaxID=582857 RepID=A0ABN1LIV1_9ALTE